jgi:uncharacterized protein YndB with AHSA1/START domain
VARAYTSTVVPAPADEVWAVIRDFNALPDWWPNASTSSEIEDGKAGDQVSAVRRLGGQRVAEILLMHSDQDRAYSYSMPEPIFPIKNHLATIQVRPITDSDHSFVEWSAVFDAQWDEVDKWEQDMSQVLAGGLAALKARWET